MQKLEQLTRQFPEIFLEARGRGLLLGLEINIADNKNACKVFATRCAEKGVYFGYLGIHQEVLRIVPPLMIGNHEIEIIYNIIKEVACEMQKGIIPEKTIEKAKKYCVGLVILKS